MHSLIDKVARDLGEVKAMVIESYVIQHREHLGNVTIEQHAYDLDTVVRCSACNSASTISTGR